VGRGEVWRTVTEGRAFINVAGFYYSLTLFCLCLW